MYRWINSKGEVIKTRTIKEFSEKYSMSYSMAKSLHCGSRVRIRGFCSTSPKAKARKYRKRFLTKLVNTKTGEECILGPSVKKFASERALSLQGLSELINGRVHIYRDWVLKKTLEAANLNTPYEFR